MPAVPYKDEMNYNHQAMRCAEGMENGELASPTVCPTPPLPLENDLIQTGLMFHPLLAPRPLLANTTHQQALPTLLVQIFELPDVRGLP